MRCVGKGQLRSGAGYLVSVLLMIGSVIVVRDVCYPESAALKNGAGKISSDSSSVSSGIAPEQDSDSDGIPDEEDNCPLNYNPGQEDFNSDSIGNACCCVEHVGDVNGQGGDEPTIGDVSVLIDALFITGDWTILPCPAEADVNQSGGCNPTAADITISDISLLVCTCLILPREFPHCLDCP